MGAEETVPFTNLNLITVTGQFFLLSGAAARGTVTFTPSVTLVDTVANEIIVPVALSVTLNSSGEISIALPATDDPDLEPTGWTYVVVESITGARTSRSYEVEIPHDTPGGTIDLADMVPAVAGPVVVTYALSGHSHGGGDIDGGTA